MKLDNKTRRVKAIGLAATIILGLLFHQLYKTSKISLLGMISPVNENKWEHWKMIYSPMMIVGMVEYVLLKKYAKSDTPNYVFALAGGILVFEATTFGLIGLHGEIFDHTELWVHVSTYLFGGFLGCQAKYLILGKTRPSAKLVVLGYFVLIVQFVAFTAFTFDPPRMEYFKDSLTQTYGNYNIE